MTKLKIKVTKSILEQSKFCTSDTALTNCAIAVAVREIFPYAKVRIQNIWIYRSREDMDILGKAIGSVQLPVAAERFIRDFDATLPHNRVAIPELEFEVDIPDAILESINIEEVREILRESEILKLEEV